MLIDGATTTRVERALADGMVATVAAMGSLNPASGATAESVGGGQAVLFGPGMWVNRVVGLGLGRPVTDADFDRIDELFAARRLPVELDVNPMADESLLAAISARAMTPVWFRSLLVRQVSDDDRGAPQSGVMVRPAHDLAEWQTVSATGFGYDDVASRRANDAFAAASRHVGAHLIVATIDGRPVGAAALSVGRGPGAGVATLYGTCSVPSARRLGVQTALIGARLAAAAESGCNLAVSTTTPGSASERNLLRHGFVLAATKLGVRGAAD